MKRFAGYQILQILQEKDKCTCQELSKTLKTTNDKIRSEIEYLNKIIDKEVASILMKRGKGNGYSLIIKNKEKYDIFLKKLKIDQEKDNTVTYPTQRIENITLYLINKTEPIKLEDLAQKMFVSPRQINNDLKVVRVFLDNYVLKIENIQHKGIIVTGTEFNKRLCIANLYISNFYSDEGDFYRITANNEVQDKISKIKEIIVDEANKMSVEFSDIAFDNLVIHIFVMSTRASRGTNLDEIENRDDSHSLEKELSINILNRITNEYDIQFSEYDYEYLKTHIACKRTYYKDEEDANQESEELTIHILKAIDDTYQTSLINDSQLRLRLTLHLAPLLIRIKNNIVARNPMQEDIKIKYALSHEMAVIASRIINEKYNVILSDDELAYIALHFELSAYQIKIKENKVLLICHTGKMSSEILRQQIQSRFENYLSQIDISTASQCTNLDLDSYSFILSTVPVKLYTITPVYVIDSFLDDSNFQYMSDIFKIGDLARNSIINFFPEDLFISCLDVDNREEAIKVLAKKIHEKKEVDERFYDSIMERESLSATDYGNRVALPHPMITCSEDTFTSIAILKKPIKWNDNMVNIIFLSSINNKMKNLRPYYYVLTKIISNEKNITRLINEPSYSTFTDIIKDFK